MATIHFFNPMESLAGGSEHRLIGLFDILSSSEEVRVWSEGSPHAGYFGRVPIGRVLPTNFPKEGTFVFVGTYFKVGGWMRVAMPRRVVIIHNIDQPERLRSFVAALADLDFPTPEIVYASSELASRTPELAGIVQNSPIDLERFRPFEAPGRPFSVGRMSRDVREKHHPDDPELYRRLSADGFRVRIMGGTSLDVQGEGIELMSENAEENAEFLRSLDAFIYRTRPDWYETFGRVTFEAMASGLPIVVEQRHGFAEWMSNGETAIFAESTEDFCEAVARLHDDLELRRRVGGNARTMMERLYGELYREQIRDFYAS